MWFTTIMDSKKQFKTIDEYIAMFPPEIKKVLEKVRQTIHTAAPGAVEGISYGMPSFTFKGSSLVYFGGWKNHIGFYPIPSAMKKFAKELSMYESGKGSVKFPLDQPIPYDLITRIVKFRAKENVAKGK
jgi:uncharacterized protein YdhG (YjbR/CyaY superfamily)